MSDIHGLSGQIGVRRSNVNPHQDCLEMHHVQSMAPSRYVTIYATNTSVLIVVNIYATNTLVKSAKVSQDGLGAVAPHARGLRAKTF
eukprot:6214025-Pleurochrysis_carterae.AAC.6